MSMKPEALADGRSRPPTISAVGHAGASVRPAARVRPTVPVRIGSAGGRFEPSDRYVRRFWVAAIGPGAVTELLRLIRAAGKGEDVRLPRSLPLLLKAGLASVESGSIIVDERLPIVPLELRWRFPPSLAAQHSKIQGLN